VQILQRAVGTVFGLSATALIVFWTVKDTKPSGSAVFPVLYGALAASALIWLLVALLRRRESRSHLDFHIEGVLIGETDYEALLQPTIKVSNTGIGGVVVHGWQAKLELSGQAHDLRHVFGQGRLRGSVDLPFLNRIGPLEPGQTYGLLQFAVPGLRQALILDVLDSPGGPVKLLLEARGQGRRKWHAEADLSALAAQKLASTPVSEDGGEITPLGGDKRVGIRNHPGAKSRSRRDRFASTLDIGIENMPGDGEQPGGESDDEDSTFE
jgi:hypothetical protein